MGKTVDDIMKGFCQVAAVVPHTYQDVTQLLAPTKHDKHLDKVRPSVGPFKKKTPEHDQINIFS